MRLLLLGTIVGFAAMHHQAILEHGQALTSIGDSTEVVAAIELRCGEAAGVERTLCEADLRDAIDKGTTDAGTIVRLHCTHFENGWREDQAPSPICATVQES